MVNSPVLTTWQVAAEIMGTGQIVPIRQGFWSYKFLSEDKMAAYDQIPFSEEELETARNLGLTLVAMPRLNLLELRAIADRWFQRQDFYFDRGEKAAFSESRYSRAGYHLLYPELTGSADRTWEEQLGLQPVRFTPAYLAEVAYLTVSMLATNGQANFSNCLRCQDLDDVDGPRVLVTVKDYLVWVGYERANQNLGFPVSSGQFRPLSP